MSHVPVFFNPFSQNCHVQQLPQLHHMVEMDVQYPIMHHVGNPVQQLMQLQQLQQLQQIRQLQQLQQLQSMRQVQQVQHMPKRIEYVGCVFINRSKPSRCHDIILIKSDLNVYEAFGIIIAGNFDPLDSMNTILNKIGYGCTKATPFIDIENPINGKMCRIYVINMHNFSCTTSTLAIQSDRMLKTAFTNFRRFSVDTVLKGTVDAKLNTFSRKVLNAVASNLYKYT